MLVKILIFILATVGISILLQLLLTPSINDRSPSCPKSPTDNFNRNNDDGTLDTRGDDDPTPITSSFREPENSCPICYEGEDTTSHKVLKLLHLRKRRKGSNLIVEVCESKHMMCQRCIAKWRQEFKQSCPFCRAPMTCPPKVPTPRSGATVRIGALFQTIKNRFRRRRPFHDDSHQAGEISDWPENPDYWTFGSDYDPPPYRPGFRLRSFSAGRRDRRWTNNIADDF